MSVTIADNRVDQMHDACRAAVRALDRLKVVERDLAEIRKCLEAAAEAIYDGTFYDPEGERLDA
jgi:argininosuccinate synthase